MSLHRPPGSSDGVDSYVPMTALLEEYDRARSALHHDGAALHAALQGWLVAVPGLKVHSVTLRIKDRESLARKLARPDRSYRQLWDVTDLIGLRVITYFEDAIDRVGELIETQLSVDLASSIDKRRRDAGAFGYRSLHYVCRMATRAEARAPHARCEVQIRTVLEHAWAEIEHDLGYKAPDAVPMTARHRLQRLAGLLELADQEFVAIRRELADYSAHLPQRIEAEPDAVPLDRLSVVSLLECTEVASSDRAIAEALGRSLADEPFFPDYLVKLLVASGLPTASAARAGIRAHGGAVVAIAGPYFAFAKQAWRLAPDRILRGYSLFFMAHVAVLSSSTLRIDKVERLARVYRELDYPDDPRAAHHVASQLVDTFGDLWHH